MFLNIHKNIGKFFNAPKNNIHQDIVSAPAKGEIIPITQVSDEVFNTRTLGDGVALGVKNFTTNGYIDVFSPVDGVIKVLHDCKHAIAIESDNGNELLIHVGLDTVSLVGEPFISYVSIDQKVKTGDKLLNVNIGMIEQKKEENEQKGEKSLNLDSVIILVFTNPKTEGELIKDMATTGGVVEIGEKLFFPIINHTI